MPYWNDKVRDVIAVLTIIRNDFRSASSYRDVTELRRDAVKEVAETELRSKRYKNQDSAEKTIHDACARRLKPDVGNISDFDRLVDQWLRHDSMVLRGILLRQTEYHTQSNPVADFFGDKT